MILCSMIYYNFSVTWLCRGVIIRLLYTVIDSLASLRLYQYIYYLYCSLPVVSINSIAPPMINRPINVLLHMFTIIVRPPKRNVPTAAFGKYRSFIDVASSNLFLNFAYYVIHYRSLYRVLSNHYILLRRWQIVKRSAGSTRYYCPRTVDATSHCGSSSNRPQNETVSKVFRFFFFIYWVWKITRVHGRRRLDWTWTGIRRYK